MLLLSLLPWVPALSDISKNACSLTELVTVQGSAVECTSVCLYVCAAANQPLLLFSHHRNAKIEVNRRRLYTWLSQQL